MGVHSLSEHANYIMHRAETGLYIELVDVALRPGFEAGKGPDL